VDCIQENGPHYHSHPEHDLSSIDYMTPPTGGTPPRTDERESVEILQAESSPDADLLTRRLVELERLDRADAGIKVYGDGNSV